jgi:hypothetical protein
LVDGKRDTVDMAFVIAGAMGKGYGGANGEGGLSVLLLVALVVAVVGFVSAVRLVQRKRRHAAVPPWSSDSHRTTGPP